jgi:hypothetical protein
MMNMLDRFSNLLVLWLGVTCASAYLDAQTFRVRVLDALNGKPYEGILIHAECAGTWTPESTDVATDGSGYAQIQYQCKDSAPIRINTNMNRTAWMGRLEECGERGYQNIEQILKSGVISDPSADGGIWCPRKISKKLKPIQAQVILFVKKPTWYQRNVAP